ncbi:platelet-activating factor acetyltransferase [Aureococcus anophagefferens]|nr:platelet-activating factor acetyltransferase [Aureococcus anophagefferens]
MAQPRRRALLALVAWRVCAAPPACEAPLLEVVADADVAALYAGNGPVAIRGRANLPSATSALLPEFVSPPADGAFPLAVRAGAGYRNATAWGAAARPFLDARLSGAGAVLFRGLNFSRPEEFAAFTDGLGWERVSIGGGGTARTAVGGVRTASDEPAEHTIEPHQDMAHNPAHPSKIAFFMVEARPGKGGETILVDMRAVTRRAAARGLDAAFAAKGGVRYAKKLWSDELVDPAVNTFNWQRRYFTRDRAAVDAALDALPGDDFEHCRARIRGETMRNKILLALLASSAAATCTTTVKVGTFDEANPYTIAPMTQWLDDDDVCFVFYRETSGGRSIQHLEAGDLDMAMLGSTPYATAAARRAGVSAVSILHFKGAAQALVTRPDLTAPQDLAGTVLWTPYTSTTHYILLAGLAQAGFDVGESRWSPRRRGDHRGLG